VNFAKNFANFAVKYTTMTTQQLIDQIQPKKSFLCVGLDVDLNKIPQHLLETEDPIFEFNKAIIDATHDLAVAYKPNTAFYEAYGIKGWLSLEKTISYINENYPDIFTIADAKRGDIGNTSSMYAKAFFEDLNFDSVTVAPYMGKDSVEPFLAFEDKHTIMLALTSNEGAFDFQTLNVNGTELYKQVLETSKTWKNSHNLMYVVGATKAEYFTEIRKIIPDSFLLVPGVGAQGGSLSEVCKYGMNANVGLLINSSRAIIYASNGIDFAEKARAEALQMQQEMQAILG
jgi:orotidine-5'-phosphate decarboxylase